MNNDYCLQSYRNNYQGGESWRDSYRESWREAETGDCAKAITPNWFQKTRIYKVITNPMFIVCLILFITIIVVIFWNYIRPRQFKTIYKKLLQFAGFKYSHLTNQERESCREQKALGEASEEAPHNNNSHFIIYGSSGSGKTSFLKHYLAQRPRDKSRTYVVFGRDEREFPSQNFVPLLQVEKVGIESLTNKIVVLDDAGVLD